MSSSKCIRRILLCILITLGVTILNPGFCSSTPVDSICNNIQLGSMGAGGRPQFRIFLQGSCSTKYLNSASMFAESSQTEWKDTYFFGSYNYDSGEATESIYLLDGMLVEVKLNCRANPWAHGVQGGSTCSVLDISNTSKGKNTTFPGPYPFSAFLLSDAIKLGLQKWETTTPTDQMLADWNPYGHETTDITHIYIDRPTEYQVIQETTNHFDIHIYRRDPGTTISKFDFEIEQRVRAPKWAGDIKIPESMTHIWETFVKMKDIDNTGALALPYSVLNGPPALYRLKARATLSGKGNSSIVTNWTPWRHFWIGEPEKIDFDAIHKVLPLHVSVSPTTAAIFGEEGGISTFTVVYGKPPYTITAENDNFPPHPSILQNSGSTFSVTIPPGSSPTAINYKIRDGDNQTTTAQLSIAIATAGGPQLGSIPNSLGSSSGDASEITTGQRKFGIIAATGGKPTLPRDKAMKLLAQPAFRAPAMGSVDLTEMEKSSLLAKDQLQIIEPQQDQVYPDTGQNGNIPYYIRLALPSSPSSPNLDLTIRRMGTAPYKEIIPIQDETEIFLKKHGPPGEYFLDVKMQDAPWHESEAVSFILGMPPSVSIPKDSLTRSETLHDGFNPERARVAEHPAGLTPERMKAVPSRGFNPEEDPEQAVTPSSSDVAITKIPLSFRVPTQNMIFNDFNEEGEAPLSFWFILPTKTDADVQIKKGSETVFKSTISGDRLSVFPETSMGRMYEYQGTVLLPAGKYSIQAKSREGLNQMWSSPVTFYIGMSAALKDSESGVTRSSSNSIYEYKNDNSPVFNDIKESLSPERIASKETLSDSENPTENDQLIDLALIGLGIFTQCDLVATVQNIGTNTFSGRLTWDVSVDGSLVKSIPSGVNLSIPPGSSKSLPISFATESDFQPSGDHHYQVALIIDEQESSVENNVVTRNLNCPLALSEEDGDSGGTGGDGSGGSDTAPVPVPPEDVIGPVSGIVSGNMTQRSGDIASPDGVIVTPDSKLIISKTSGFGVPKIIRPADNSTFVIKQGSTRCIVFELEHKPSTQAKDNPSYDWDVFVQRQSSYSPDAPFQTNHYDLQDWSEFNLKKEYCLSDRWYKFRACARDAVFSEATGWLEKNRYCGAWHNITVLPPETPQHATVQASLPLASISAQQSGIKKTRTPQNTPTLIPLPRGAAFAVNSMTSLPVKHVAGQKPVYEFEYYDGKAWRKERSILPKSMHTPQRQGMTQVITKASFRITKPGKYRYRVKTEDPASPPSPYQEFVVVDQRAISAVATDNALNRTKADSTGTKTEVKSLSKSVTPGVPKSAAGRTQVSESVAPKAKHPIRWDFPTYPPPPVITSPNKNQTFLVPTNVVLKTTTTPKYKVILEMNGPGMGDRYEVIKGKTILRNLSVGTYRVHAKWEGSKPGPEVTFHVKMPIPKNKQAIKKQAQPQVNKQAVKKKAAQPAAQPKQLATPQNMAK